MGLYQYVGFSTHNQGNILDLVISELGSNIRVKTTTPGPFISDHHAVISVLTAKRETLKQQTRMVHKLKKVTQDQWNECFNQQNVKLNANLDEMVQSLEDEFRRVMDELAPELKCTASLKPKHPWYDAEAHEQKWIVRKLERRFIKYKLDSLWTAFKKARNKYNTLLNHKKRDSIRSKIKDCSTNPKKLHKLITNLTKPQEDTKWPKHTSKSELADSYTDYFESKILTIRKLFNNTEPNRCEPTGAPKWRKFGPLTQEQVKAVICSLNTKLCELDPIPTQILKKMLPTVVPLITKIVNLSLGKGTFAASWKNAIVWPLLKKLDLALIHANYRPVSNLPFISKIAERCMLLQLSHHCEEYNLPPDYQSTYRANYSCEMVLLGISNDILWAQERQSIVSLVAIDLSVAFDTVNHDILLDILNNKFGVEDKALKWFDSYLRPCSYHVVIEGPKE